MAVEHHADAIELDVKLTADEIPVVIHDPTVDRTTDGSGKVRQLTLKQIKQLDAGKHFDEKFKGEPIPTLDEVLGAFGKKILINIELTNYSTPGDNLVPLVVKIIKAHGVEENILFSSFLPRNLRAAQDILPQVPVAILCLPGLPGLINRSRFMLKTSPAIIHPYLRDVTPELITREHQRGRWVHTWTVNEAKDIQQMLNWQVDGLFTDDPLQALAMMGRN
jgi:glycerophosphoryl diester phosphodiesterase